MPNRVPIYPAVRVTTDAEALEVLKACASVGVYRQGTYPTLEEALASWRRNYSRREWLTLSRDGGRLKVSSLPPGLNPGRSPYTHIRAANSPAHMRALMVRWGLVNPQRAVPNAP